MIGRRAIFGLCMLCAMPFSAIAAQGASAAGQTAFTCVSTASKLEFKSEHCVPGETGTAFGHEAFSEETHGKLSNEKTNAETTGRSNAVYRETIAATNLEMEATGLIEALGTIKNEEVGGEMRATAETDANGMTANGVKVTAPAGKGCKVFADNNGVKGAEGVIKTGPLKVHTTVVKDKEGGVEKERHSFIVEPREAGSTLIATFFLECEPGKVPAEIQGTWEITGTLTCPSNGATLACNHETVTEAKTLKGKGAKAGIAGKLTATAGKFPVTELTHPVSVTTTTP